MRPEHVSLSTAIQAGAAPREEQLKTLEAALAEQRARVVQLTQELESARAAAGNADKDLGIVRRQFAEVRERLALLESGDQAAARKLAARRSYLVAIRRKSFNRLNMRSIALRPR